VYQVGINKGTVRLCLCRGLDSDIFHREAGGLYFIRSGLFFTVNKATERFMQLPIQTLLSVVSTSTIADSTFNNIWKRIQVHSMKRGKEVTRRNPYVKRK